MINPELGHKKAPKEEIKGQETKERPANLGLHPDDFKWRTMIAAYSSLCATRALLFDRTPLRELSRFHGKTMFTMEGFMRPIQYQWFEELFSGYKINRVAEVGFNGGHSAYTFAYLGSSAITSFDLGEHPYVMRAAEYLRGRFPQTSFELILGDSAYTVPEYPDDQANDLIFIDGGHTLEAAAADIENMQHLAKPNALVVVDDYTDTYPWRTGPKEAYDQAVSSGLIETMEVASGNMRTWVLGRYTG